MYDIISRTVKRIKNIYQIIFFTLYSGMGFCALNCRGGVDQKFHKIRSIIFSHSISERDSSDHPVSVFSQTAAWICFKIYMDVSWKDPYQVC